MSGPLKRVPALLFKENKPPECTGPSLYTCFCCVLASCWTAHDTNSPHARWPLGSVHLAETNPALA